MTIKMARFSKQRAFRDDVGIKGRTGFQLKDSIRIVKKPSKMFCFFACSMFCMAIKSLGSGAPILVRHMLCRRSLFGLAWAYLARAP